MRWKGVVVTQEEHHVHGTPLCYLLFRAGRRELSDCWFEVAHTAANQRVALPSGCNSKAAILREILRPLVVGTAKQNYLSLFTLLRLVSWLWFLWHGIR